MKKKKKIDKNIKSVLKAKENNRREKIVKDILFLYNIKNMGIVKMKNGKKVIKINK